MRRVILSDAGLAVPGSSADDVARAIRSRHREYQRYKLELFASVVRRAISSLPPAGDACSDSASPPSRRCRSHDTTSSSTTLSPPSPAFDVTKSLLRSSYSSQKSKRDPDANQQLEMEVTAEKVMMPDAEGGHSGGKGVMFADLGGMESVIEKLMLEVVVPLCQPELPLHLGVRPVTGILLHGPPGCGKTTLAHAIANETGVPFYKISATEVVSGVSGASEENIRTLFSKAYRTAPSIVFIDEIDAIASKRENMQREMERRVVTQLMTCMDEFHQNFRSYATDDMDDSQSYEKKKPGYVIVIGATNRPDAVDQALRRPGRFDREISLGVPDENARKQILERLAQKLRLPPEGQFNLLKIAKATPGFVGADLKALVDTAGSVAIKRIVYARKDKCLKEGNNKQDYWRHPWDRHELQQLSITMDDFEEAITEIVQPSMRREGFSSVPDVTWACVGGLDSLKKELDRSIVQCIKYPEYYKKFGVNMQAGVLLFGPPGCGKTLIAKAVAHDSGANFIHIKGPEVLNRYVGESESDIRKIFTRARINSPCILFFDEVDALTTKRGKEGAWVVERLLNQLLIELDGADQREGVYVIGATNRIDVIDDALLRPGRLGQKYFVPLPSANERHSILKALTHSQKKPVSCTVDLDALARREECNNLTGADLASLVNEAAKVALEESLKLLENGALSISSSCSVPSIELSHFEQALSKIKPSVSEQQRKHYEALSQKYSAN